MINHGAKCTHCGGLMSEAKAVLDGPRKGHMQKICTKCGHIHYMAGENPQLQPQQIQQQQQQQNRQ